MTWVAVAVAGGTIVGGLLSSNAQENAANTAAGAQMQASQLGIAEQRRQFDFIQHLLAPYVSAGTGALSAQQNLLGLNGAAQQASAIAGIQHGPQFQSMLRQGQTSILQNASATGGLRGGNTEAALGQFSPMLLSQLIQQQLGQYGGLAGIGRERRGRHRQRRDADRATTSPRCSGSRARRRPARRWPRARRSRTCTARSAAGWASSPAWAASATSAAAAAALRRVDGWPDGERRPRRRRPRGVLRHGRHRRIRPRPELRPSGHQSQRRDRAGAPGGLRHPGRADATAGPAARAGAAGAAAAGPDEFRRQAEPDRGRLCRDHGRGTRNSPTASRRRTTSWIRRRSRSSCRTSRRSMRRCARGTPRSRATSSTSRSRPTRTPGTRRACRARRQ
jgi:hypothetical protein